MRVALRGRNGAGKSTILRLASGQEIEGENTGSLRAHTPRIAFLDQRAALLDMHRTLLENITRHAPHLKEEERRLRLARFLFRADEAARPAQSFSGGEKLRAALACVLCAEKPPLLLFLDEPTNNLDIDSVERLESALQNFMAEPMANISTSIAPVLGTKADTARQMPKAKQ